MVSRLALALTLVVAGVASQVFADSCTLMTNSQSTDSGSCLNIPAGYSVDAFFFGVCETITNSSGLELMVPVNTPVEWTDFYSHAPTGVTAVGCSQCSDTQINYCILGTTYPGYTLPGYCSSPTTGSCSYYCNTNDTYSQVTNTCTMPAGCTAQTIAGNCNVSAVADLGTSGTCASGYTGSCSYTCGGSNGIGNWGSPSSNTCGVYAWSQEYRLPCYISAGQTVCNNNVYTMTFPDTFTCSATCDLAGMVTSTSSTQIVFHITESQAQDGNGCYAQCTGGTPTVNYNCTSSTYHSTSVACP